MAYNGFILALLAFVSCISCEVSVLDDPTSLPGHLQPLGTGRPITKVAEIPGFPEPDEFFKKYVKSNPKKAVIFKGGAKLSPAFQLWNDDYLKNHPESEKMEFDVEVGKKETRQGNMEKRSVKNFIETFRKDDIYAVTDVPQQLRSQFLLPPVLRCGNIKSELSMMLMWFSSGGTKSVLHQDSFENINCLFRGKKRLLIAEYPKYKKEVVIDRPNGYSSVDVDKVDFGKYPGLAKVDYYEAVMEEGDCLYIPFQWFHQVTSFPNANETNVALNVWWYKNNSYTPQDCTISAEEATLDRFRFQDQGDIGYGKSDGGDDQSEEKQPYDVIFQEYFKVKNTGEIPYDEFVKDIQEPQGDLADVGIHEIPNKKRREKFAKLFFEALDVNQDGILDFNDYNYEEDSEDESEDPKRSEAAKKDGESVQNP